MCAFLGHFCCYRFELFLKVFPVSEISWGFEELACLLHLSGYMSMAKQLSVRLAENYGIDLSRCCRQITGRISQRISRIGMISTCIGCEGNED